MTSRMHEQPTSSRSSQFVILAAALRAHALFDVTRLGRGRARLPGASCVLLLEDSNIQGLRHMDKLRG